MISLKPTQDGNETRDQAVPEASASRIVNRPVPETQARDPRKYQVEQLRKRFSPKESNTSKGATSFVFKLKPSDPDFPFELAHLDCDLHVPRDYPIGKPELNVRNKDIPRGFSINVEKGWDRLVAERKGATLLSLINALDKNLEKFLSEQKVETVKVVTYKDTRHIDQEQKTPKPAQPAPVASAAPKPAPKLYVPERTYTKEEVVAARQRRAQETRQLEARMGRLTLYRRSADGVVYTLPLEPRKRDLLPSGLRSVNNIHLIVPHLYPLQDVRVTLNDVAAEDAEAVEEIFVKRATDQKQMTLMSHINYLAQNLHAMAKQAKAQADADAAAAAEALAVAEAAEAAEAVASKTQEASQSKEDYKGHLHIIPRPPEWSVAEDDEDSEDFTESDEDGGATLGSNEPSTGSQPEKPVDVVERGTMISFPSIELYGIELIEVAILSLTVKCERCKTANEITGLKPEAERTTSCKKCGTVLTATFHQTLVHEHSTRAGFVDLVGCKVADMLPSTFIPTCAKCSTPGLGLVSVRGESMTNVCRECHGKFTFKIPEVKFLFITPGMPAPPTSGPRRKQEKLGLHAGEQLPNRGACAHYRKSYRWFRFSCCSKVHPCDRCHDEAEDHMNEWANRMICGWCSREQNYSVEVCNFCGRGVIGRKGRGFWEGGKGTRDQRMMSRKDPRKYKRIGTVKAA